MLLVAALALALWSCQSSGTGNQEGQSGKDSLAQEPATELPSRMATTVLENPHVRVKEMTLSPGADQPLHKGGPRVVYSLTDYKMSWREGEGEPAEKSWSTGDVHWHDAGTHAVTNTGQSEAVFLVAMWTDEALPACDEEKALDNDVNKVSPDKAEVLFENEHAKVTKVTLEAGAEIPSHTGANRVIYALSDYSINFASDKEGTGEHSFEAGQAHWHEACTHSLSNTGETTAEFLVIAFKNKYQYGVIASKNKFRYHWRMGKQLMRSTLRGNAITFCRPGLCPLWASRGRRVRIALVLGCFGLAVFVVGLRSHTLHLEAGGC